MVVINVIAYSGGKDSTALWLWARRTGIDNRRVVFADTGWEHPGTIAYIAHVSSQLGEAVTTVRGKETFEERVRRLGGFPSSGIRWCTEELKVRPTRAELDRIRDETGDDVQVLLGIRADESRRRATMPEREWSKAYDCEVWRPLLAWTLEDVIAEHHRAGVDVNPLYKLGAERVGCWPCINAGKGEIELVSRLTPGRVDLIRDMERDAKNTMFSRELPKSEREPGSRRTEKPLPIDDAVAWSRTERGGRQIRLVQAPSGCARWGICEPRTEEAVALAETKAARAAKEE